MWVKTRIGLSLVTLLGLVLIVWVKTRIGLSLVTLLDLVLTGKHTPIHLSFMEVGHTRCLVGGHFGLIKKLYRHMHCCGRLIVT